jgi:3D-(3,5/4)-trihydroxycyclohexane-1,2-dione acylhydrolase (decyclizing)
MGAWARKVFSVAELESALREAEKVERTTVLVIDTDPLISTEAGGHWWDVAVPEVSVRPSVNAARKEYEAALKGQRL